jgi:hypothetical protein
MAATTIGCHVRDAGSWKRIEKCHVKDGGSWKECQKIHVKSGGFWRVVWADDIRALGSFALSIFAEDPIAPYAAGGGWKVDSDGQRRTFETPPDGLGSYSNDGDWLAYDLNRTYQVKFTLTVGDFDTKPTTGSWLATTSTRTIESQRVIAGVEQGTMLVEYRRNEGTPTAVLKSGNVIINIENGLG